ncbi:hypothetical protein H633G_07729 [Metarhizium anisopliae BRIP 53284]|nr:hypothetical protein H633G_07729 [Metarhizium anisopliae BRIP 53284]
MLVRQIAVFHALIGLVCSHSWVERLMVIGTNGTMIGNPGYIRGAVSRLDPNFNDFKMQHLLPTSTEGLLTDKLCKNIQRNRTYTTDLPALQAAPGAFIALQYQENGHVTLPGLTPQKKNSGTVYVYGTLYPRDDELLSSIHNVWNTDGTGGDGRGRLLACQVPIGLGNNMSSSQSSLGRRKRGSQSPVKRTSQYPSKTNATPNTTSTRSTGPYDRAFQQNLIDHNIFPDGYEYPDGGLPPEPENMNDILAAMAQPRPSLSPSRFSNDDFRRFKRADTHAFKEREITTNVIPLIEGTIADSKCVAGDVPFTNLDDLTDGTIVSGKPDLYHGARPEQLDIRVRREQSRKINPSSQSDLPILANFFLEAKGPDGTLSVASRQSCYNGALGARGMLSLQSYGQPEPEYDNKAYTISSIYHGGTLKMYTSHPIPPRDWSVAKRNKSRSRSPRKKQ